MPTVALATPPTPSPLLTLLREAFTGAALEALAGPEARALPESVWEAVLYGPLQDMLARPGKGLRARWVEYGWRLGGGEGPVPALLPQLVELLHVGSLIVDDIEDGAIERRGGPALHRVHGLATALNAGNWLYFLPFQLVEQSAIEPGRRRAIHEAISDCLLASHYGQALDLGVRIDAVPQRDVPALVLTTSRLKTGSLGGLALRIGALAAGAGPTPVQSLAHFGRELGVGLQMLDDLTSLTREDRQAKFCEDLHGGRATWPWAWIAAHAEPASYAALLAAARHVRLPSESIDPPAMSAPTGPAVSAHLSTPEDLQRLAESMRVALGSIGRIRLRRHLRRSCDGLATAFPEHAPVCAELRREVLDMERSYG